MEDVEAGLIGYAAASGIGRSGRGDGVVQARRAPPTIPASSGTWPARPALGRAGHPPQGACSCPPTQARGSLLFGALVVPHRARDPPPRAIPVEREVVHASPEERPLGGVAGFVGAPHLGHVAEPLDTRTDLDLVETLRDEVVVRGAAELLRRLDGRDRLAVAHVHGDERCLGGVQRAVPAPLARRTRRPVDHVVVRVDDALDRADVGGVGGRHLAGRDRDAKSGAERPDGRENARAGLHEAPRMRGVRSRTG